MKIVYSPQAIADLRAISAYLKPVSPQAAKNVRTAMSNAVAQPSIFPRAGTPQTTNGVRQIITRKYPYPICYAIDLVSYPQQTANSAFA